MKRNRTATICQQRFWLQWKLDPSHTGYNLPFVYDMAGPLNEAALQTAFARLVERHEALRTTLREREGRIEMCIAAEVPVTLHVRPVPDTASFDAAYERLLDAIYREPFDLVQGPVFRVGLLRYGAQQSRLVFCIHHLAIDGSSHGRLLKDLSDCYRSAVTGDEPGPPPEVTWTDYAAYERKHYDSDRRGQALDYWMRFLSDTPLSMSLPVFKRGGTRRACAHYFALDDDVRMRLAERAHENGSTFFEAMAAAWAALLQHYTRQHDVVFSYPVSIRPKAFTKLTGTFVNNLPMHVDVQGDTAFMDLLGQVSQQRREGKPHQHCSLTAIVERLRKNGALRPGDTFLNVGFGQTWLRMTPLDLFGLEVTPVQPPPGDAMQDLMLEYEPGTPVRCRISGCEGAFPEWFVRQAGRHFSGLLRQCVDHPRQPTAQFCVLDAQEKKTLLDEWNDRRRPYETTKTLPELFARQAKQTPDNEALCCADRVLTYAGLHEQSNRMARVIRRRYREAVGSDLPPGAPVGLCVGRSERMIAALWAILKAGGAYVPLDPAYPPRRLRFMLEDAGAPLTITDADAAARAGLASTAECTLILLEALYAEMDGEDGGDVSPRSGADDPAYIIYTSGTTGHPKGVAIQHRQVANLVACKREFLALKPGVRMLQIASINFDGSVASIFPALLSGACLCIAGEEERHDAQLLFALLERQHVHCGWIPPALLAVMPHRPLPALRTLLVAGESTAPGVIAYWSEGRRLMNAYGPTENTVEATAGFLTADDPPNDIGEPLPNVTAYVLNPAGRPVPVGIPGELYIGGVQLFNGYLNRPALNAEKLVPNPFASEQDRASGRNMRLYRTGDLVRWLPGGHLEFLGRADTQIKVRGFRIEPAEIERTLATHPDIKQALILPVQTAGDTHLVAYVIGASPDTEVMPADCQAYLSRELPDYMIPAAFVRLSAFPMTPGGKINRRALPPPAAADRATGAFVAPQTDMERTLAALWSEVLGMERTGIHDRFFELGGHSLLAVKLAAAIEEHTGLPCPVSMIFEHPTIAAQAEALKKDTGRALAQDVDIPRAATQGPPPLSYAQQRLWFMDRLGGAHSRAYNMPVAFRLRGPLDPAVLEQALTAVIEAQESLRTVFPAEQGTPCRKVLPAAPLTVQVEKVPEQEWPAVLAKECDYDFDLAEGPLFRVRLLRIGTDDHILLLNQHHIISDGWSVGVLVRQLQTAYGRIRRQGAARLAAPAVRYTDYAAWQRARMAGAHGEQLRDYWRNKLAHYEELELPTDFPPADDIAGEAAHCALQIPGDLRFAIERRCEEYGVTHHMFMLMVFQVLLARYSRQEDILVGSPLSGRENPRVHDLIGFFVNILPFRTQVSGDTPLPELLESVKQTCLEAQAHQALPFDLLVEAVGASRDVSRVPLVPVVFVCNEIPEAPALPDVQSTLIDLNPTTAKFDLMLTLYKGHREWECRFEYKTRLFEPGTISRMAGHYLTLLEQMVGNPRQPVREYTLLTPDEQRCLEEWNDTWRDYPRDKTLSSLFAEQAQRSPDNIALRHEGRSMSYRALDERANRVAHTLLAVFEQQGAECTPGTPLALFCEPGIECIVGITAILKAGGAYLPIKSDYPPSRIAELLEDSGARIVLTQSSLQHVLADACPSAIEYLLLDRSFEEAPGDAPVTTATATDTAYLMYTSGSTGKPKGAQVPHRAVARLVLNTNYIDIAPGDRFLQASNIAFDAATLEIWGALLNGATLVCVNPSTVLNRSELATLLAREGITVLWLTAALFHLYAAEAPGMFRHLRVLASGGDVLNPEMLNRVMQCPEGAPEHILNCYGPTENTTFTTTFEVTRALSPGERVPIGKPIANTTCYILDAALKPCPVSVPGELYTGGDGVALGYLNRPDLTAERFVPNPFADARDRAAARNSVLYRTGDLARWRPDGTVDFLGRTDFQVKIRGFRVEPGEIENRLHQLEGVQQALVLARTVGADKKLIAYYVAEPEAAERVTPAYLRDALLRDLPDYMVPVAFVCLASFPVNPNGKVDRNALPIPDARPIARKRGHAPRDRTEKTLAECWCELLDLDEAGIHDNFFDMGGHSLLAVKLGAAIERALDTPCPVELIFRHPTIAGLADMLKASSSAAGAAAGAPLPRANRDEPLPLSTAQWRLWFLDQREGEEATSYNMPMAYRVRGPLDPAALESALNCLVARHESLRTVFPESDGVPCQQAVAFRDDDPPVKLQVEPCDENNLPKVLEQELHYCFDLARGPLFRVRVLRLHADEHVLLFNQHHIISDGWSVDVMLRELADAYEAALSGTGYTPPALPLQYADYTVWHTRWLQSAEKDEQLDYWKRHLEDGPALELPTDKRRPAHQTRAGANECRALEPELRFAVESVCRDLGVTPFVLLQSVFRLLLQRYCRQDDIMLGIPATGRTRPELERIIGFFVNILPLRVDMGENPTFARLADRVRRVTLDGMAAQNIPFDLMVDALDLQRDAAMMPLVQVVFILENFALTPTLSSLELEPINLESDTAKFDMTFMVQQRADNWQCRVNYNTDLFEAETMRRLLDHFKVLLRAVTENPYLPVGQYSMLTDSEYNRIVVEWNRTERLLGQEGRLIHEIFEEWARRQPGRMAVMDGRTRLTYGALNQQANRLAHSIRIFYERMYNEALKPNTLIGLCMDRGANMLIAMLGILKAGGAYIPIDPTYPEDRIGFMLEDSQSRVVLTDQGMLEKLLFLYQSSEYLVITVDAAGAQSIIRQRSGRNPAPVNTPGDLAYVIYTSGSTGKPKGVMIPHACTVNMAVDPGNFPVTPEDRVAQIGKMSFDISTLEIWAGLLNGAGLVILDKHTVLSADKLSRHIREDGITVSVITTALFNTYVETAPEMLLQLRTVMFGGEEANADCAVALARRADNRMNIINGYGPTEITVDATNYFVTTADADRESIPIGKALANKKLYVLDPFMNPLPVGVPGELFIGGIGVADGYLNRPDITAERFLDNPFATARERQTGRNLRIYRTGDLVKWEPDGNLLYIGRTDFQVKIRGFRIEPGEIETVMRTCPNVIDCVVLTPDIGGSKTLVGYYVPAGGAVVQPEDLRAHLARQLPDYMIPSHLVACPCFPLTPGGKINRQALPLPTISESAPADQRAPRNPTEKDVVSAFKTVLASGEIGLATNFFDAGGTSLQAVTLTAHLQKQYNITVNDIFRYQTVGLLADHIQPHEQTLLHRLEAVKQAAAEQNAADVAHRDDVPPAWHEELTAYRADNRRYHDVDLSRTRDYRQIMLTGATGFLGAYLLREMLEHSSATMHLPIRANGIEQARQRLAAKLAAYFGDDFFARHSRRLHVLCSDLAQPRLGLDARTYQQLSQTVDCIINSAALVKHYGHLADFQTANVKTVENLVAFAHAGQRKELHHMSTVSVGLGHDGDKAGIPWTEDRFAAGQHSDNHYVSTKCEAEQRILSARADGLTATIYRLGNMLCDSVTGAYQQNIDDNGFFQTLKAFCEIGAVSNTHDECEISHVDQSARAVRLLYDKPALANETFHIRNPHCVKLSEILTDPSLGLYLDTLSFPDFIDRLITLHDTEGLRAEVEAVLLHRGWLSSGAQGARVVPFSERTEILLQRLDFAWQPPQARQLLPLMHEAMKERLDLLAAHPLFKDMDAGQRRRLAFSARRKIVPERTILWQKDDPHTTCGIIRSGHVALFVTADSGVDVLVDACGPGRAIGCEALLDNTRAQHSAKTMEDETDLLCLDGTLLKTMSRPWAS